MLYELYNAVSISHRADRLVLQAVSYPRRVGIRKRHYPARTAVVVGHAVMRRAVLSDKA